MTHYVSWHPYQALYIHIPFCKRRCYYCDFVTQACSYDDPAIDAYVESLISQIRQYSNQDLLGSIKTVYIGGGTPSFIGNKRLSSLLYALSISMHLTLEVECSMEVNPDSLSEAMVKDLYALGVTRLSLGVQSFNDMLLSTLGRIHNADQAKRAIDLASQRFDNISIDLMCGLPGQNLELFQRDLEQTLSCGVKHISIYPLAIERDTHLEHLVSQGKLSYDEDFAAECMEFASQYLTQQGLYRYEVASYAYEGYECRHNRVYWSGIPYLGIGHGAVSMRQDDLVRQRLSEGELIEELDIFQMAAEDCMLAMRTSSGVSDDNVDVCSILLPRLPEVLESLEKEGLVVHAGNRWIPTEQGWLFGNVIYGRILELAP